MFRKSPHSTGLSPLSGPLLKKPDSRTDRPLEGRKDGKTEGRTDRLIDGQTVSYRDAWTHLNIFSKIDENWECTTLT